MTVAAVVLPLLLAVALAGSAVAKLLHVPAVVASVTGVGWPRERLWVLAAIELLGALGLVVGLFVPGIGVAAAVGATLYFLAAVAAHARLRQAVTSPAGPLVLALATTVVLVVAL